MPRNQTGVKPAAAEPSRPYPDFTPDHPPAFRDFGRNGSFLVVRRLAQNVEGFAAGTAAAAADLNGRCLPFTDRASLTPGGAASG